MKKEEYFKTWLTRILINHCNAIYRKRKNLVWEEQAAEPFYEETSYANVEWRDFLNGLEKKYRLVIILYYVQGFKTREIARILDLNENTVQGQAGDSQREAGKAVPERRKRTCVISRKCLRG